VCESADGNKKYAGTIGKIGCTSFFPSKVLGCFGDGGALFTDDDKLADRIRCLANHGQSVKYNHRMIGINSRLDTIQAAVLRVKLNHLDEYIRLRTEAASRYSVALAGIDKLALPDCPQNGSHVWHQYTIKTDPIYRDSLKACLEVEGIPSAIYYNKPLYDQPAYRDICRCDKQMADAGILAQSVLSLPMHTELTAAQQYAITDIIRRFFITADR
ncbi:MAG: DegT/DnrJ/EryC1/StrS family aminotransferase, partial [Muribaculaceae bacterium]|nr:DegT/DnrJ/EryC1/StrS family aminotransferase [Muribaculaceae bacterium]